MTHEPPVATRKPTERVHHGDRFVDDYEWLRDKDDPHVIAHLEAENAWTRTQSEHLAVLEEQLFEEIKGRTKETDLSVPVREGDWWYYSRTVEGQQYSILARVAATEGWTPPALPSDGSALPDEQVLLDSNQEAEGHEFFSLGSFDVSSDGRLLLWAVDTEGDERYTVHVRDLTTGTTFPDTIDGTAGGAIFDPSGRFVFYTTVDDAWRPDTVWRHELGGTATRVFTEPDDRYWVGIGLTRSRRFLVIELGSKITSEAWLLPADDPTGSFSVVWPRREGVEYEEEHAVIDGIDRLLITNNDGAEDFQVVSTDLAGGDQRMLVPHTPGTRVDGIDAFAENLVLSFRREGLERVAIGLPFRELEFDEELFSVALGDNPSWDQPTLRLGYGSFVTPSRVLSLDLASRAVTVLK